MKFTMTKIAAAVALSAVAMSAQAVDTVSSMTIQEIGSLWSDGTAHVANNAGAGTAAGYSGGAFGFVSFAGPTPNGSALAGFGGTIINGTTQSTFGSSFDFGVADTFTPNSCGALSAAACASSAGTPMAATVNGADSLAIDLSSFGGLYSAGSTQFRLSPQVFGGFAAVLNLEMHNSALGFGGLAANQFYYSLDWAHEIQSANGDVSNGSTSFNGNIADFHIEGIGTVAAVPEASTYGMMLAGLGLVGFAVRRRKLIA